MKRLFALGALCCALALGACAGTSDVEKSLIAAHATYDGVSIALQTATTTGVLHGSAAQEAQSTYDQVGQELAAADAAWTAGNQTDAATHVANANAAATKLCTSSLDCRPTVSNGSQ
jgi:hypothetical protein